jgi:hypothetical protein
MAYALGLGIAVTCYRLGERWAWYLWWLVLPYGLAYAATSASLRGTLWVNWGVHLSLELLWFLQPHRKFFPKRGKGFVGLGVEEAYSIRI